MLTALGRDSGHSPPRRCAVLPRLPGRRTALLHLWPPAMPEQRHSRTPAYQSAASGACLPVRTRWRPPLWSWCGRTWCQTGRGRSLQGGMGWEGRGGEPGALGCDAPLCRCQDGGMRHALAGKAGAGSRTNVLSRLLRPFTEVQVGVGLWRVAGRRRGRVRGQVRRQQQHSQEMPACISQAGGLRQSQRTPRPVHHPAAETGLPSNRPTPHRVHQQHGGDGAQPHQRDPARMPGWVRQGRSMPGLPHLQRSPFWWWARTSAGSVRAGQPAGGTAPSISASAHLVLCSTPPTK